MKKIFLISSLVIIFVGLVFVVMRNRPTVNDVDSFPGANKTESTTTNGTNGAVKIKPPSGGAQKKKVKTPGRFCVFQKFFKKFFKKPKAGGVFSPFFLSAPPEGGLI